MATVFPEKMNVVDYSNLKQALQVVEDYLRYACERTEFAVGNVTKAAAAAGNNSAELEQQLTETNNKLSGVASQLNEVVTDIQNLQDLIGTLGQGDMAKSVYDKDGNGTVDNAEKVNGHTVNADVPAGAKFTDTVYTHPKSGVAAGTFVIVTVDEHGHVTAGNAAATLEALGIVNAIVNGTLEVKGTTTFGARLTLANGKGIWSRNGANTDDVTVVGVNASDNVLINNGGRTYGNSTYIDGNNVYIRTNNGIILTGTSFKFNDAEVSLDGHKHKDLYYTDGVGGVVWVLSGGAYYLRSADNTKTYYLGSQNYRWDTIYAKNALNTSSDMRLKKDFSSDYDKYIAMLDLIEPTTFVRTNTDDGKRHTGYIAQQVLKAMKDTGLAETDFAGLSRQMQEDGSVYSYGLMYEEFIPILHAKIKQLEQRIETLEQSKEDNNGL